MTKQRFLSFTAVFIAVTFLLLSPVAVQKAYAACNAPTLFVKNSQNDFLYASSGSAIVMNDKPTQGDTLYATAVANCSGSAQYNFFIHYLAGSIWTKANWTGWSYNGSAYLSMDGGIRQYEVGVQTSDGGNLSPQTYYWNYYGMTKTSSVSSITATSAQLSWSLRMPFYTAVLCPPGSTGCTPSPPPFFLLLGTNPAILSNRSVDEGDIKVPGYFKDIDAGLGIGTVGVDVHAVSNLTAGSTYYWRIRTDFPQIDRAFFAGGTFAILPNLTANPPALSDANPAKDVPLTFQATVKNTGPVAAIASSARFCIDNPKCDISIEGRLGTADLNIPALNPAVSYGVVSASWTPDIAGTHAITFCTDVGGVEKEQNEGDNCQTKTFTVVEPVVKSCSITSSTFSSQNIPSTYTLSADVTASSTNETVTSYKWNLGDGSTALTTDKNPLTKVYAYPNSGNLTPNLQITDSRGSISKITNCTPLPILPAPQVNIPMLFTSYTGIGTSSPVMIAKSTNGGGNPPVWGSITAATATISQPVSSVSAADGSNIFLAYQDSGTGFKVIKSANGGQNWAEVLSYQGFLGGEKSIFALNDQTVFVLYTEPDKDLMLAKSTDGGKNWATSKIDSAVTAGQAALFVLDANNIMAAYQGTVDDGNGNNVPAIKFAKSTDGGKKWEKPLQVGHPNISNYPAIAAADANNIFISFYNNGNAATGNPVNKLILVQSKNAGVNWGTYKDIDTLPPNSPAYPSMTRASATYLFLSYVHPGDTAILPKLKFVKIDEDTPGNWIITLPTEAVNTSGALLGPFSSVSAADLSNIFISYFDKDSKKLMLAGSRDGGGQWSPSAIVSSGTTNVLLSLSTVNPSSLPPTVITKDAGDITENSATLQSSVNPNNSQTTSWFRYDTKDPAPCNDTFGTKFPADGDISLTLNAALQDILRNVNNLTHSTTYYFCAIAKNSQGLSFGLIRPFTTASPPPTPTPTPAPAGPQGIGSCGSDTARATGLVSTPDLTGTFSTTSGACIIDPKAAFAPFKIPTFDDLKSLYFTQSKAFKATQLKGNSADFVYSTGKDLTLNSPSDITGNQTGVIFVDGMLSISNDIKGNSSKSGLVFVVKGNVNIDQNVTQIDAVIVSEGVICTAHDGTSCMDGKTATPQLTINGSLISLNPNQPVKFRRTLSDNSQPAEKINHQVKYLVILRSMFSDTYQKWSEIP